MIAGNITLDMRTAVEGVLRRIANADWCPDCNQLVELLTVKEASGASGTTPSTLLLWILKERIHCLDLRGRLLICAASLQRCEAVTGDLDRTLT
jgi:hypothetical protein